MSAKPPQPPRSAPAAPNPGAASSVVTLSQQPTGIRITPTVGEFSDVEPGMVFVIPFVIHNVSNRVSRVRFTPPKTSAFRVIHSQQSIAPGMKQVIEVEFSSKEVRDYHDVLVVRTEEGEIPIPLHAWFPAPNLKFEPVIDLGRVSAQHPVEARKFRMVNVGKKDGQFKFIVDGQMQGLSLTPQSGLIAAGAEMDVSIHYFAAEPGKYSGVVTVSIEGHAPRRLEVVAEVVESRVTLVNPLTGEALSRLNFGKVFFGQNRQVQALLRNSGQHPVSFTVRSPDDATSAAWDDESHQGAMPIECKPTEARLKGNEERMLTFTFAPARITSQRGWENTNHKADDLVKEWELPFVIEIVETEQQIPVTLVAKAVPSEVKLTETCFNFPNVAVNDHASILFAFTNESSELPVTFSLSRAAHFNCQPTKGTVVPRGQQNILLTFHPNQLGAFRSTINLDINAGARVIPLTVHGSSTTIGPKPPAVGGTDRVREDFMKPRKFAELAASHGGPARSATENEPAWLNEGDQRDEQGDAGAEQDLLLMSEWQQKREHNFLYNNYVTNCRNIRTYNEKLSKGLMQDANPEDVGMIPGEGLTPPVPKLPHKEDPLPLLGALGGDADDGKKGTDGVTAVRKSFGASKLDENKLIKKKFKPAPVTLNEQRECRLVLSPKEIQNIIIPVKMLDFQQVNVYSTNAKSFFVVNGTKTHIWVQIPRGIREELALSTPLSQVIPPGSTAGFDVVFRSEVPQPFQQAIHFTINETHKLKFVVFAEAVPIDIVLSTTDLFFRFAEFGHDPSVTMPVTLTNPGNSEADFQWTLPEGEPSSAFAFSPSSGTVPANGSLTVDVSYTPILSSNDTQVTASLRVKGGSAPKSLSLTGGVQASSCSWSVKDGRLDFKKVPVGATRTQTITIKNTGGNSTVFAFDTSQMAPGVTITPARGRIAAGATEDIAVQLRATTAQLVKSTVACHIRGMKQLLKFQLTAEAKVPEFYFVEPPELPNASDSRLDFGGVYVGGHEFRRLSVQNHDDVVTSLIIDLSHFPHFSICDADRRPVEHVTSEDDDTTLTALANTAGGTVAPGSPTVGGHVALFRPKVDDDTYDMRSQGDEDGDERARQGSVYRVAILPHATFAFYLCFTPSSVGASDQFLLPLSLFGTEVTSPNLRPILVVSQGKKPRLVLSPATIDFSSRVVIREGTSKAPNRILVKLSNETDTELQWELDTKGGDGPASPSPSGAVDVFRVEPVSGRLHPGQTSQVQFTFSPLEVRSYSARYAVYLDGSRAAKYTDVTVKGFGANPSLTFDRREIIMPPVPLDIPSKLTFYIGNEGYESIDLKYRIAGDGKLPVTLNFPDGQTITSNHTQLPVEVTFLSKRPMTFVVNIDFFDDADNIFSIPVTCTADNSVMTVYGYLRWRDVGAAVAAEGGERKPLLLRETDDSPLDKDNTPRGGGGKSDTASTAGSNEEPTSAYSAVDVLHRKVISKRMIDRLRVWMNCNVLPEPIEPRPEQPDLIVALQVSHGRLLSDIIELLYGKPPLSQGKGDKAAAGVAGGTKKESTIQEIETLDSLLLFLKQFGANVCDVRSEFLLRYDDYCRLGDVAMSAAAAAAVAQPVAAAAGGKPGATAAAPVSNPALRGALQAPRINERRFAFRAMHAWTTVLLQVIKVFYLSRVTWRTFRASPASPPMLQFAQLEKWSTLAQEPSTVGSNLYSVPESLLLKWLSVHLTAVYGNMIDKKDDAARAKRGAVDNANNAAESPGYLRVTNFEMDLRDSRAFAACVVSYIPQLAARFDAAREGGFSLSPVNALELERNADLLLSCLREYGMETRLTARDLIDHSARENVLFTAFLFTSLPHYVPKTVIKFKGKLLEKITKTIELSNPTKYAIDYAVSIDGCEDFKIPEPKFHLEPKAPGVFSIHVTPRFTKKVEGRVTFLSNRATSFGGATMVFALETEVEPASSIKTFDNLEVPMYETLTTDVTVDNPFAAAGQFTVQIQQEFLRDANAKGSIPEEESIHAFPEAFWTPMDSITLKKTEKAKFTLQFMPCVRGKYRARVVFREDRLGEFAYTFIGVCLPPRPAETISIQTEANVPFQREITLPVRHAALEKALAQKEERFKMFKGRKVQAAKETEVEGREITYKIELLNDKYVGPNPFYTGPKQFTLRSAGAGAAAAGDDDDEKGRKRGKDNAGGKGGDKSQQVASFMLNFAPRGPGTYHCYVMLTSTYDVRVIMIEGRARSPGMKAELEFACPARQQITQDIPVTNSSDKEWVISAQLGGEYFSGPRELRVPPGRTRNYTLLFNPTWVCDVTGQLVLKNNDTQEKYTFAIKGKAEEPLAENTIPVECRARETRKITINVPNITFDEVAYTVETDLPFVAGDQRIVVPKMEVGRYVLHIAPQLSGRITGSITFIAPNKQYVWFVVQVTVLRPPPEDTIVISSEVRKGAVAEITMTNPSDKPVDFIVRRRGEGLIGDDLLSLEPHQSAAVYPLAFVPTKAGDTEGIISFNNDDIGEFWYKLSLNAKEAAPTPLAFQCEIGKSTSTEVSFDNPTDLECILVVQNTNDVNFSVTPATLVLKPKAALRATVTYMPSAIHVPQDAVIKVVHPKAGQWEYRCKGVGLPPTKMEPVSCTAEVNRTSSTIVVFRNPFPVPKRFLATLRTEDDAGNVIAAAGSPFSLMTKKQSTSLGPFQIMQIPLAYTPSAIAQHRAAIVVQLMEQMEGDLKWEFPVVGTAECTHADPTYKLTCKSRKELTHTMIFPLLGSATSAHHPSVDEDTYTSEIFVPREADMRRAAVNALSVARAVTDAGGSNVRVDEAGNRTIAFAFVFSPLRPFKVLADLIVRKSKGGMWRFPIQLEATPPDVDDVIVIEAAVNVLEGVSFNLYNVLPQPRPFVAYFTPESPQEFTVAPAKGTLPSMPSTAAETRGAGQLITVSFASTQYGKTLTGTLIVETDEMQWRYDVKGTLPKYQPPTGVRSKVQNRLRTDTEQQLKKATSSLLIGKR